MENLKKKNPQHKYFYYVEGLGLLLKAGIVCHFSVSEAIFRGWSLCFVLIAQMVLLCSNKKMLLTIVPQPRVSMLLLPLLPAKR